MVDVNKSQIYAESPEWLKVFSGDFVNWSGLSLSAEVNSKLRDVILEKRPSLIEMRNYLFSRQCAMLLKVHKPWEVRTTFLLLLSRQSP